MDSAILEITKQHIPVDEQLTHEDLHQYPFPEDEITQPSTKPSLLDRLGRPSLNAKSLGLSALGITARLGFQVGSPGIHADQKIAQELLQSLPSVLETLSHAPNSLGSMATLALVGPALWHGYRTDVPENYTRYREEAKAAKQERRAKRAQRIGSLCAWLGGHHLR
jgi:hypothetical protein